MYKKEITSLSGVIFKIKKGIRRKREALPPGGYRCRRITNRGLRYRSVSCTMVAVVRAMKAIIKGMIDGGNIVCSL